MPVELNLWRGKDIADFLLMKTKIGNSSNKLDCYCFEIYPIITKG